MRIELTRDGIAAAQLDLKSRRPTRTDPPPCKNRLGSLVFEPCPYDILTQSQSKMLIYCLEFAGQTAELACC